MNILSEIIRGVWMIEPAHGVALVPLAQALMEGKAPGRELYMGYNDDKEVKSYVVNERGQIGGGTSSFGDDRVVNVQHFIGPITKYGSSMSYGVRDKALMLKAADGKQNVVAHVLRMDTPGGSAAGLKVTADIMAGLTKPVIAYVDGMAASAGMWLASTASEIHASDSKDLLGSIGTMIAWVQLQGYYEKHGAKVHEIYATLSKRKNEEFRLAEEKGDYSLILDNILNPHNEDFHNAIRSNLPVVNELPKESQDMIFSGAVFTAEQAMSFGIVQGIGSFEASIKRAFELGKQTKKTVYVS